jgi:hypothetical protein
VGLGQREVEDRDALSAATAAADRDDLVSLGQIDPFDPCGYSENVDVKGKRQVFLHHREKTCALFRLSICVDDRLLDQLLEPTLSGRPTGASPLTKRRSTAGSSRHCQREVSPKTCASSPVVSEDSSPKLGQSVKFFARANGAAAAGRVIRRDRSPLFRSNLRTLISS